jgi:hypothetical protein
VELYLTSVVWTYLLYELVSFGTQIPIKLSSQS